LLMNNFSTSSEMSFFAKLNREWHKNLSMMKLPIITINKKKDA
jgi:hypothetical protein